MNKDVILREAIKQCPGAMKPAESLVGFAFDVLNSMASVIARDDTHEYFYPNIPAELVEKLTQGMHLSDIEIIYYVIHRNISDFAPIGTNNAYFIITTDRIISCVDDDKVYYSFYWENINSFGLNDRTCSLEYKGDNYELPLSKIIGASNANPNFQEWLILSIVDKVNIAKQNDDNEQTLLLNKFYTTFKVGQIEEVIARQETLCTQLDKEFATMSESAQRLSLKIQANLNFRLADYKKSINYGQKCIDNVLQYEKLFGNDAEIDFIYGLAKCFSSAETFEGYKNLRYIYANTSNLITFSENTANRCIHDAFNNVLMNFLSYDYNDRRFLVIDSSMSYLESDNFVVLPKDNLPEGICFPLGHPQEQELYVCHPYNHNLYIPYESHEFELFKDKMDELRFVLQAMGAKSIRISDINGVEGANNRKQHTNVTGDINAKVNKFHADGDFNKSEEEYEKLRRAYETESVFNPQQMPFIPDNLVWYPHQPEWKRLFEQRNNGLIKHRICISVDKEAKISTQKQLALKTDFQALFLKTNANVKIDTDSMFEEKRSSEWVLEVEFESLDVLRARENGEGQIAAANPAITALPALTDEEQQYMEEVKFCLEDDNKIDDKERRLLERIRVKFGISEVRAAELENMVALPAEDILSAEEQEYCKTATEYAADGELSERDLRLLSRLASSLDISPEREKELLTKTIYKYE